MVTEQQPHPAKEQVRPGDQRRVPGLDPVVEGGPPAGLFAPDQRGETGERDPFIAQCLPDHRDHVARRAGIGMEHADQRRTCRLNPGVDLPSAPGIGFDELPACCAHDLAAAVGAAAIDHDHLNRLRIEGADQLDQCGQRLFLVQHRNDNRDLLRAQGRNSGQSSRSSAVSISESSGRTAGRMPRATNRRRVSSNTLSVLHGISVKAKRASTL